MSNSSAEGAITPANLERDRLYTRRFTTGLAENRTQVFKVLDIYDWTVVVKFLLPDIINNGIEIPLGLKLLDPAYCELRPLEVHQSMVREEHLPQDPDPSLHEAMMAL